MPLRALHEKTTEGYWELLITAGLPRAAVTNKAE